jgi:hypothetical protein
MIVNYTKLILTMTAVSISFIAFKGTRLILNWNLFIEFKKFDELNTIQINI